MKITLLLTSLILLLGASFTALATDAPIYPMAAFQQDDQTCPIDLVLVLDGSSSIAPSDFDLMKAWSRDLIARFTISTEDAQVGVIQFSSTARIEANILDNATTVDEVLQNMRQANADTNITDGLQRARELLLTGRADAPKVIIVLTDGNHNIGDGPIPLADEIRADDTQTRTTIIGVAVGSFDLGEIIGIAGGEFNVINVPDFEGLRQTLSILRDYSCAVALDGTSEIALQVSTPTPSSSTDTQPNPDIDVDGVPDLNDNCPFDANPDQTDADGDAIGDVCDSDSDDFASPFNSQTPPPPIAPTAEPTQVADAGTADRITSPSETALFAGIPPELSNTLIAFSSNRDGDSEIYIIDAEEGTLTQITNNTRTDDKPDISPDGTQIAWESDVRGAFNIWVADIDGSNARPITDDDGQDWGPSWSPDGSRIAFHTTRGGVASEIWVMNSDGSNLQRITQSPNAIDRSAAWSPDGNQLVFFSDRTEGREIYIYDLESGTETQLTDDGVYDGHPDWSSDGSRIAFGSTRSDTDTRSDICLMNSDGSNIDCLVTPIGTDDDPSWSPDGEFLAFESGSAGNFDVWIIRADGSRLVQLTNHPGRDWSVDWGVKP